MLSSYDADLVRRDMAIPGLATLLDPEAFRGAASVASGVEITGAWPSYIRYKPGMNCLVAYELEVDGGRMAAYAKGHRADANDQLRKAQDLPGFPGPLGAGRVVLTDQAIVLSIFPNDSELKTLGRLADSEAWNGVVRRIFSGRPDLWEGKVNPIRYKPERRYVAQLVIGDEPRAVLKMYTPTGYAEAKSSAKAFKSGGILLVPRRIGKSDGHLVLAFEWMRGRLLSEALLDRGLGAVALERVGTALAKVHTGRGAGLAHLTREAEASGLLSVAAGLAFLCPDIAERVQTLAREIALRLIREPEVGHPIHGDFYAKQVLLDDDRVVILDFDSAAAGDPAADLGLFIAHLERGALRRSVPHDRVEPYADALLSGYSRATRESSPSRVGLYTAAGLLRLAPHPFRNLDPNWPHQIERTVARAEAILRGATSMTFYVPDVPRSTRGSQRESEQEERAAALAMSAMSDPTMPFLAQALNPFDTQLQFRRRLARWLGTGARFEVPGIRVVRHKRGRRCLVEYDLLVERPGEPPQMTTLVGKARARGLDRTTYEALAGLYDAGFAYEAEDGISVPQPVGMVPEFQMWLHRKVPGTLATHLLAEHGGPDLARRIAEALRKLHSARVKPSRGHTIADELAILHEKLPLVAQMKPEWTARIERLLWGCDRLGAALPTVVPQGIHRDFYADHVLQDGKLLYLLDFDLYCLGDPALDAGNFVAHIQEMALRKMGNRHELVECEEALIEHFLHLSDYVTRFSVDVYTLLTLVRHIYLSTQFADRQHITEALLHACEEEQARLLGPQSRKLTHRSGGDRRLLARGINEIVATNQSTPA